MNDFPMILEREMGLPEGAPAVAVGFGYHQLENKTKSAKSGHPIYEEVVFVKVVVPGDKNSVVFERADRPEKVAAGVERTYKERFPRAYELFQKRATAPMEGTPLEQWPQISRAIAMTLKAAHIHTVEALAEVHDGHLDKLPYNIREMRQKARAYLSTAKDAAMAQERARENDELKARIAELEKLVQPKSRKEAHA